MDQVPLNHSRHRATIGRYQNATAPINRKIPDICLGSHTRYDVRVVGATPFATDDCTIRDASKGRCVKRNQRRGIFAWMREVGRRTGQRLLFLSARLMHPRVKLVLAALETLRKRSG
jgi:hypothetical protein